jgi:PPOX class probable F420-dependent enzyme
MALDAQKYLLLTTFRRDGAPVSTQVWVVPLADGRLGFWTSSGSGKAKRLVQTGRVTVQPCDARSRVTDGTSPTDATAQLVTGAEHEAIRRKVRAKYGFTTTTSKVLNTVGGTLKGKRIPYGDRGVVITLAG